MLRREGLRINDQTACLGRVRQAIEYGRSLVAKFKVESLVALKKYLLS